VAGLLEASRSMSTAPGSVSARHGDGAKLPFADGEADAACCISVLEHVDRFDELIREISRILRPEGLFVLTVDLDLRGDRALSVADRARLVKVLRESFFYLHGESSTHPADILTCDNGPFRLRDMGWLGRVAYSAKQYAVKPLLLRRPYPLWPYRLTVEGFALLRRP
jgi:ubiquinone/menaquinone biosynthesis C-methylase UbiE